MGFTGGGLLRSLLEERAQGHYADESSLIRHSLNQGVGQAPAARRALINIRMQHPGIVGQWRKILEIVVWGLADAAKTSCRYAAIGG